jgi:hypothetical protein
VKKSTALFHNGNPGIPHLFFKQKLSTKHGFKNLPGRIDVAPFQMDMRKIDFPSVFFSIRGVLDVWNG